LHSLTSKRDLTTQPENSQELLSLQNRLLLAITVTESASECVLNFMRDVHDELKLKSCHLVIFSDGRDNEHYESCVSLPDDALLKNNQQPVDDLVNHFKEFNESMHVSILLGESELLCMAFGSQGVFILENSNSFQESLADTLLPVISKLSKQYLLLAQRSELIRQEILNKDTQLTYELQAKRDPLTNLPNRREFRYSLSKEISNTQRYDYYGALMYIDLDNFKNVNDSLGHSIGDILLTLVAQRLTEHARGGDSVFRIGGDEFVYILSNIGTTIDEAIHTAKIVANRVIEILAQPIEIGEYSLHVTPSIGIAMFPDGSGESSDSENILRQADTAMYRAKQQGRNGYEFFDPEMHVEASKRLIIEDYLRKALKNSEFSLVYQPIVNTDEQIIGAETLVRWNSPTLGQISPEYFISIAEESNLILELSDWIFDNACSFAETVYDRLGKQSCFKYISINISPRQFIQNNFVESIVTKLKNSTVPNEFIKLEFTENVLLDNVDSTIQKMEQLIENKIDFLLDDFGTGYSSLSYLHKLPIWLLKIDKSFVTDFTSEKSDTKAIVNAIMVMAEELGIKCIVEGVELQEHVDHFKKHGVHGMQGYYFHKPMPPEQLLKVLFSPD